jgi:hypothetical protein
MWTLGASMGTLDLCSQRVFRQRVRRFGGTNCFYLQDGRVSQGSTSYACCLLSPIAEPEDCGSKFPETSVFLLDYRVPHSTLHTIYSDNW